MLNRGDPRPTTRTTAGNIWGDIKLKAHLVKWFLVIIFILFIFDFIPDYGACQYNHYFPDGIISFLNPFDDQDDFMNNNINFNASFRGVLEQNCMEHNLTYLPPTNLSGAGFCVFPNGNKCDAFAYYNGRCQKESNCSFEKYTTLNYFLSLLFGKNDELNELVKKGDDKDYYEWIKTALVAVGQMVAYLMVITFIFIIIRNWQIEWGVGVSWLISLIITIPFMYYIIRMDGVMNLILYFI